MSFRLLEMFLKGDISNFSTDAPKDMKVIGVGGSDPFTGTLDVLCESEQFKEVAEGAMPPEFKVTCRSKP